MLRFASLLFVVLLAAPLALAQEAPLRRVTLTDGTVYVGTVADESADPLVVVTTDGVTRTFARAGVETVAPLIRGRFFRTDPVRTRLFLSPTARTVGGGNTRLSILGAPNVAVGLSDRVDVSATGFLAIADGGTVLPLLGAKATVYQSDGLAVGLGTSVLLPIGEDVTGSFGAFPYVSVSVGDETRSVNVALTGAVVRDRNNAIDVGQGAVLSVGGETQINNGVKLIADGFVPVGIDFDESFQPRVVVLPGVRFFGNRFAFDLFGAAAVYTQIDYSYTYSPDDVYAPGVRRETGRRTKVFAFAPVGGSVSYTF